MSEASETATPIRLRLAAIERQTELVWLFSFVPVDGSTIEYLPGQVALLETADGRVSYIAIASAPFSRQLEFLVKRAGPVGEQLFESRIGEEIVMHGPSGTGFRIDRFKLVDLVLVAQGSAIGAIRSALLEAIRRREEFGSITLIYGARTPDDFNFVEEFDSWREHGVKVELTCTQPGDVWVGAKGRVQSLLAQAVRDTLEPVALVCGSAEMMDQSTAVLESLGLPSERILRNY